MRAPGAPSGCFGCSTGVESVTMSMTAFLSSFPSAKMSMVFA